MNFLDKITKGDKKKNENPLKNIKNPFAAGHRKFGGEGKSLGGSRPGKLISVVIEQPGPVGVKIEKRPNKSAIVALVVEGSQADAAGIQRGDVLCYADTDGEEEIMYEQFLALAASSQRPLYFDVRRVESTTAKKSKDSSSSSSQTSSAEAYARKQAVIAAAEAREKAHKQKTKPIPKGKEGTKKTSSVQQQVSVGSHEPMTEESKQAAAAAKADETLHAAQLGYNPYETARATAGQARTATVAMTHGTIQSNKNDETAAAPTKPAPPPPLPVETSPEFEEAYTTLVTTNEEAVVKSSIGIMHKLIVNATTKGQVEDAAKFRKVRLSNLKIKAAITDVNGALDVMLAVGFQLVEDDGESFLVYPPAEPGPDWLPDALDQMKGFEQS